MSDLVTTIVSLPELVIDDLFVVDVVDYQEVRPAELLRQAYRFGYTEKFAALASSDDRWDYIKGLVITTIIVLSIFLVWAIILLIFKCLGAKRVGFLSGSAFTKPKNRSGSYYRPFISRVIFLLSCAGFIVFSVLFNTEGMQYVYNTADIANNSLLDVTNYAARFVDILIDVADVGSSSEELSETLSNLLEDEAGKECLLDTGKFSSNFDQIVLGFLSSLDDFLPQDYDTLTNYSKELKEQAGNITERVPVSNDVRLYVLIFTIFYITTPAILLFGVIAAWCKIDAPWLRCLLSWAVLPIFCLQVIIVSILTSLQVLGTANADFCSGGQSQSPDGTIVDLLLGFGLEESDLAFKISHFYIGQCTAEFPFQDLSDYFTRLVESAPSLNDLGDSLTDVTGSVLSRTLAQNPLQCTDYANELSAVAEGVLENVVSLAGSVKDVFDILSCESLVPLYTNLVYDGTCDVSIRGFTWLVISFLVMSVTGFIMIMLRSSWQLDVIDDNEIFNGDEKKIVQEASPQEASPDLYLRGEEAKADTTSEVREEMPIEVTTYPTLNYVSEDPEEEFDA
mmetsp:Transcript_13849/g.20433  ORF Transcript_13849/g.20433 Transcript_13849/m.20433 type:complete len:566 (+) Transcript_13849:70-1767(+)